MALKFDSIWNFKIVIHATEVFKIFLWTVLKQGEDIITNLWNDDFTKRRREKKFSAKSFTFLKSVKTNLTVFFGFLSFHNNVLEKGQSN